MKKITILLAVFGAMSLSAQTSIDFESATITPNPAADPGADPSTDLFFNTQSYSNWGYVANPNPTAVDEAAGTGNDSNVVLQFTRLSNGRFFHSAEIQQPPSEPAMALIGDTPEAFGAPVFVMDLIAPRPDGSINLKVADSRELEFTYVYVGVTPGEWFKVLFDFTGDFTSFPNANGTTGDFGDPVVAPFSEVGVADETSTQRRNYKITPDVFGTVLSNTTQGGADDLNDAQRALTPGFGTFFNAQQEEVFYIDNLEQLEEVPENFVLSVADVKSAGFSTAFDRVGGDFVVNSVNTVSKIEVFNILGQVVASAAPNSNSGSVSLGDLNSGLYIVTMTAANGASASLKVVK